jgi:hypothetical protein
MGDQKKPQPARLIIRSAASDAQWKALWNWLLNSEGNEVRTKKEEHPDAEADVQMGNESDSRELI